MSNLAVGDIVATVQYTDDTKQTVKRILNYCWVYGVNHDHKDYDVLTYVLIDGEGLLKHNLACFGRVILIQPEVFDLKEAIKKLRELTLTLPRYN